MHLFLWLTAIMYPVAVFANPDQGLLLENEPPIDKCDCEGVPYISPRSQHICHNPLLGPNVLPWKFPMLSFVSNYDRFGKLKPGDFLKKWGYEKTDEKTGYQVWRWKYPDYDGFHLDFEGKPMRAPMRLERGFRIDRFGSPTGRFVAAADASFNQRALPPDVLNPASDAREPQEVPWNYHIYEVLERLWVMGGPVAPAFEQPGLGVQFDVSAYGNVSNLVKWNLIKEMNVKDIVAGPDPSFPGGCGSSAPNCSCEPPPPDGFRPPPKTFIPPPQTST